MKLPLLDGRGNMKLESSKYKSGEKALTHEEYRKLLSVISDVEDELLIKMAVATGLRREDLCNILISNIDLKEKKLLFHEAKKDKIVREESTKDEKGRVIRGKPVFNSDGSVRKEEKWRTIDISPQLITTIEKFLKTIDKKERSKRIMLFSFRGRQAYNRFNTLCKKAEINTRPFHGLRATCIKFAHDAGWQDEQICKLTGDTLSVIQMHYRTPSVSEMAEVTVKKEII